MKTPLLTEYDWIVLNSSAGKDSQAMLDVVIELATLQGVRDRVVVVHCDLGRVEWQGTRALAEEHAKHYGVRFEVVSRPQGDLLTHVEQRGLWPGPDTRYCTSQHKTGQVYTLFTRLVRESGDLGRPVRILNCLGIRAQESPVRSKKRPFVARITKASNGKRTVSEWFPVFRFTVEQVWARIAQAGTRAHDAYALGMPRLSCCFCILAPKPALVLAGTHNRALLDAYVAVEERIGHRFTNKFSIREVRDAVEAGCGTEPVADWQAA